MGYSPKNIVHQTSDMSDNNPDVADQADRLTMIMEAEAARNGALGVEGEFGGEGSLDGYSYPLRTCKRYSRWKMLKTRVMIQCMLVG